MKEFIIVLFGVGVFGNLFMPHFGFTDPAGNYAASYDIGVAFIYAAFIFLLARYYKEKLRFLTLKNKYLSFFYNAFLFFVLWFAIGIFVPIFLF